MSATGGGKRPMDAERCCLVQLRTRERVISRKVLAACM
jgi:hypothetical protein